MDSLGSSRPEEAAPAGWYPDPNGHPLRRYWDGHQWTEQTSPAPPPTVDDPRGDEQSISLRIDGYRTLSAWLRGLLWVAVAIAVLRLVTAANAAMVADDTVLGLANANDMLSAEAAVAAFTGLWLLALLTSGIVWIVWLHRSHRLVSATRGAASRYGQGWTIGAWFVPVANLWIPKQIHDDIWRRTRSTQEPATVTPLLHWWWALWIGSALVWGAANSLPPPETFPHDDWSLVYWGFGLSALTTTALSVIAVFTVRQLTARVAQAAGNA